MPRRTLHTLRALGVALSLLAVGLIVGASGSGTTGPQLADIASPASDVRPEPRTVETRSVKSSSSLRRARARETMALPFFSFAQGLRSGNGS